MNDVLFQQVGAEAAGALYGLLVAPFADAGFMAREEYVGHAPAVVVGRTGVDRGSKQIVLKRVAERALFVAYGARYEAHDGVGDDDGGKLATRQHVVADRNLAGDEMFAYAVVNALVVAAKYDDILEHGHRVGHRLVEKLAVGRSENHLVVVAFGLKSCDAAVNRLDLHHHARLAAERIVVDLAVLVGGIVAQIVDTEFHKPFLLGTFQYRATKRRLKHLGKYSKYIDTHIRSVFDTLRRCLIAPKLQFDGLNPGSVNKVNAFIRKHNALTSTSYTNSQIGK